MAENEDDWVRKRAYSLWEEEGYPAGKDRAHWEQAKRELDSFSPGLIKRATSRRPAAGTKTDLPPSEAPAPATSKKKATRPKRTINS